MDKENEEIRYSNVTLNSSNIVKNFPLMVTNTPDDPYAMLLIYQFNTPEGPNYVVIGKLLPGKYPTSEDYSFMNWIYNVQKLLYGNDNGERTYPDFLKQLSYVKQSEQMNRILFTQEGYDLLNGKFFFQEDGLIQRTVEVAQTRVKNDLLFLKECKPINEEGKMSHIAMFAPWDKYEESYFLNRKDLLTLIPGESALLYAVINKDRLFNYVSKHHDKWGRKHNLEENKTSPEEVADYALQLVDVVTNLQIEENELRNKRVSKPINKPQI